ncbi:hypothetical protein [Nonomuraea candida]|uniref:hypothetical protein n=1 Tax=Nonomuraea candida TaxID=359159 RepID=UPI003F6E2D42
MAPLVIEAGARPVGSWPRYYDSLTLFSPARHSALPGRPFPGDPDRYPGRDEVVAYLLGAAAADRGQGHAGVRHRHIPGADRRRRPARAPSERVMTAAHVPGLTSPVS